MSEKRKKKISRKKFTSGENFNSKIYFDLKCPKNEYKFSRVFREISNFQFLPEVDLRNTSKFQEILANMCTFLQNIFAKIIRESVDYRTDVDHFNINRCALL